MKENYPDNNKIYYVYYHINFETNEIFYVGKGKHERAHTIKDSGSRSLDWKAYVSNILFDYHVVIHKDNLDEKEALRIESNLIAELSLKHKLLNKLPNKIIRERQLSA